MIRVSTPYKLASTEHQVERTRVRVNGVELGLGQELVVMAGPCAVESREQLMETARCVKREGARVLRGGAFKPRTLAVHVPGARACRRSSSCTEAHDEYGLPVVTEVIDPADVPVFEEYVDILQVGARNMQNFVLLKAVGQSTRRCCSSAASRATIEEWLLAAEYILVGRQPQRDPVRARHPHLRDRHAQHARPLGGARPARSGRTCRSSSIPATAPGTGRWSRRWPWRAPPSAPMA